MVDKFTKYTFDDLWDAVCTLNPNYVPNKLDFDSNHMLSMIIPNLIAEYVAEQKYSNKFEPIDISKIVAYNLLVLAYYNLCHGGCYNLKED